MFLLASSFETTSKYHSLSNNVVAVMSGDPSNTRLWLNTIMAAWDNRLPGLTPLIWGQPNLSSNNTAKNMDKRKWRLLSSYIEYFFHIKCNQHHTYFKLYGVPHLLMPPPPPSPNNQVELHQVLWKGVRGGKYHKHLTSNFAKDKDRSY